MFLKKGLIITGVLALAAAGTVYAEDAAQGTYVLMNIPYAQFYAAEADNAETLDAVSSATQQKTRRGDRAGGSYHIDPSGSDVSGVIYPVLVEDMEALEGLGGMEITDDSSVEITTSHKGEETTAVYEGREALFEAPDYSWYVLPEGEEPALYKTMTAAEEPEFSAIEGEAEAVAVEGTAAIDPTDDHKKVVVKVDGLEDALGDSNVSGVVLTADDGSTYGLRHIQNIYKRVEFGFDGDDPVYEALQGKTITGARYITMDGQYTVEMELTLE